MLSGGDHDWWARAAATSVWTDDLIASRMESSEEMDTWVMRFAGRGNSEGVREDDGKALLDDGSEAGMDAGMTNSGVDVEKWTGALESLFATDDPEGSLTTSLKSVGSPLNGTDDALLHDLRWRPLILSKLGHWNNARQLYSELKSRLFNRGNKKDCRAAVVNATMWI